LSARDRAPLAASEFQGRSLLAHLYDAAVAGAAPGPLTTAALLARPTTPGQRVHLFALGKAAHAMCAAAIAALGRSPGIVAGGAIVARELAPPPDAALVALAGDHPLPGAGSFDAAEHLGERVALVREGDLALVLLSGGASSLVAAPVRGVTERDLVALFDLLHRSGLDIHAMNTIRKRFTRWGAGRLAVALAQAGARTHVLVMSDVPGDDPADVASGPCTPDISTAADVLALLLESALLPDLPAGMREQLEAVRRGALAETPKPADPAFAAVTTRVIGSNRLAVAAVVARARELDLDAEAAEVPLEGEAGRCGVAIADALLARARHGRTGCLVWGGETTVRRVDEVALGGRAPVGGRCQELALAAAGRLAVGGAAARRVTLLAAGTDGRDGPTDAAGAFADATVWSAILQSGRDPARALARHDSHAALDAAGALLRRGATGTNVMDVVIGVVG
jgi:hydroxypyruvate reductase